MSHLANELDIIGTRLLLAAAYQRQGDLIEAEKIVRDTQKKISSALQQYEGYRSMMDEIYMTQPGDA